MAEALRFLLEKRPGYGEDARPLWRDNGDDGTVAVFDGLGGAGAAVLECSGATQAAIAARLARDVVRSVCAAAGGDLRPEELATALERRFAGEREILGLTEGRIRSKLIKLLPTTLAVGHFRDLGDRISYQAVWAGDSRVYLLTPSEGLQQLSTDDLIGDSDAWHNLRDDAPLRNMISASGPVVLRSRTVELPATEPAVLIAATDGCFGYLPTPMHMESQLLWHLGQAADYTDWMRRLARMVDGVSGDDASMAIVTPRRPGIQHLRAAFELRARWLFEWLGKLDGFLRDNVPRQQFDGYELTLWQEYKARYERLTAEPAIEVRAR